MAFEQTQEGITFPGVAATGIKLWDAVVLASSATQDRAVAPVASHNQFPLGIAQASAGTGATLPQSVTVQGAGAILKVTAGATVAVGQDVHQTVGSSAFAGVAGASGQLRFAIGQAVSPASPGELFSLYINPRIISGIA